MTRSYPHEYLFKCTWRATALLIKVGAKNEEHAQKLAEGRVMRMEGGVHCLDVKMLRQLR